MSDTQIYKTVTFKTRISVTVETALSDYIANNNRMLDSGRPQSQTVELLHKNIERAKEALDNLRAGSLHEGMKP